MCVLLLHSDCKPPRALRAQEQAVRLALGSRDQGLRVLLEAPQALRARPVHHLTQSYPSRELSSSLAEFLFFECFTELLLYS